MVSALDSGSGGPGSSPGRGTALCSWARNFTLIVPLWDKLRPNGPLGWYTDFKSVLPILFVEGTEQERREGWGKNSFKVKYQVVQDSDFLSDFLLLLF